MMEYHGLHGHLNGIWDDATKCHMSMTTQKIRLVDAAVESTHLENGTKKERYIFSLKFGQMQEAQATPPHKLKVSIRT